MGETDSIRCGFIAVIGLPNAGKSTLINTLVGQKVSITSKKAQTTRCRVLGIALHGDAQMVFIDTPGVFDAQGKMERAMVGAAYEALEESDCIVHLVDASQKNALGRAKIIQDKLPKDGRVFLALNKIDTVKKPDLLATSQSFNESFDYKATFMISALKDQGLETTLRTLSDALPESPWLFDEDEVTDMPMRMMAAEITREKIFHQLHDELPYSALVQTEEWEEFDNGDVKISQVIFIQRDSQKAIVLGKGGSRIKQLGQQSRTELEDLLGRKVHLKLFVNVMENCTDRPESMEIMWIGHQSTKK